MKQPDQRRQIPIFTTMTIVVGIPKTTTAIVAGLQKLLADYYYHRSSHTCFCGVTNYGYRSPFNITIGIGIFFIEGNSLFNANGSQTSETGPPKLLAMKKMNTDSGKGVKRVHDMQEHSDSPPFFEAVGVYCEIGISTLKFAYPD